MSRPAQAADPDVADSTPLPRVPFRRPRPRRRRRERRRPARRRRARAGVGTPWSAPGSAHRRTPRSSPPAPRARRAPPAVPNVSRVPCTTSAGHVRRHAARRPRLRSGRPGGCSGKARQSTPTAPVATAVRQATRAPALRPPTTSGPAPSAPALPQRGEPRLVQPGRGHGDLPPRDPPRLLEPGTTATPRRQRRGQRRAGRGRPRRRRRRGPAPGRRRRAGRRGLVDVQPGRPPGVATSTTVARGTAGGPRRRR